MARGILHVGYTAGKRGSRWRVSRPTKPAQSRGKPNGKARGSKLNGKARGTIHATQMQRNTAYAAENGFDDLPDMTDWSMSKADKFYNEMTVMVAGDVYTHD